MALSKLDSLYMAVVSDHSKNPHHYGSLEGVEQLVLNNPTCGDVLSLSVRFEDDKIADIAFSGEGCSISTASASMMTDAVLGKTRKEAKALSAVFSAMVQGQTTGDESRLGEARLLSGVAKFPQRIKCATLGWHALEKVIEREEHN
ncbi:Fe-S cluster assembly sulfur transfer protein SufU [Streptococcus sp. zg-JUN1979]|uniref:Fe-S cluster assembly sulfur transfer protein SufU n=1 Tax=Streptococcus sp. zg-JUN1979 TaxID=3391450 RepID=UPI0039A657EC